MSVVIIYCKNNCCRGSLLLSGLDDNSNQLDEVRLERGQEWCMISHLKSIGSEFDHSKRM